MVQYLDFHSYLPGDILTKVDRASMAHSLEGSGAPAGLPVRRVGGPTAHRGEEDRGEAKYALKESLLPYLPREVLYRTKMGFAVPLDVWFRGSLKEEIARSVSGERLKDSGSSIPTCWTRWCVTITPAAVTTAARSGRCSCSTDSLNPGPVADVPAVARR